MRISSPSRRHFTTPPWSRSRRRRDGRVLPLSGAIADLRPARRRPRPCRPNYEIQPRQLSSAARSHWTVRRHAADITPLSDTPRARRGSTGNPSDVAGRHVDHGRRRAAQMLCRGGSLRGRHVGRVAARRSDRWVGRTGAVGRAEVRDLRQFLSPFPAGCGADRDQVTTGSGGRLMAITRDDIAALAKAYRRLRDRSGRSRRRSSRSSSCIGTRSCACCAART